MSCSNGTSMNSDILFLSRLFQEISTFHYEWKIWKYLTEGNNNNNNLNQRKRKVYFREKYCL